jgi:hypothetical protein
VSTIQSQLVCDSSTFLNFSGWASAISNAFSTFGWTQSSDTGQVVWTASVVSITAVTHSGTTNVCTYTLTSGPALRVGMSIVIAALTNSGNNGTFTITALGSGTFTVTNSSGVTESGSSGTGTVTANSTVPGSGAYVYEVWQPNDALANFYTKVEYGNITGQTNCPTVRLTLSTATNGAGSAANFVVGPFTTNTTSYTVPSSSIQYECDFSGAAGRISCILWRNGTNNCQQAFAIERSLNSSGSYTGTYVTLWTAGNSSSGARAGQQSLHLTAGPGQPSPANSSSNGGILARVHLANGSSAFNGSMPFDTAAPSIGYFDYPCTAIGVGYGPDFVEGVPFSVTLYGSTRTYMPSKNGPFANVVSGGTGATALCIRYD